MLGTGVGIGVGLSRKLLGTRESRVVGTLLGTCDSLSEVVDEKDVEVVADVDDADVGNAEDDVDVVCADTDGQDDEAVGHSVDVGNEVDVGNDVVEGAAEGEVEADASSSFPPINCKTELSPCGRDKAT